jgi:hypothetical protein
MEVKCKCQTCSGQIEFSSEMSGQTVECPHCKMDTILFIPQACTTIQVSPSSYIHKTLMPGEVVTGETVLHWVVYLKIIPAAIIPLIVACFLWAAYESFPFFVFILFEILIVPLVALGAFVNKKTSEFAVTNKRVLMKCGFIRRSSIEIVLTKIESIKVNQGILGRILDYGTIIVCGTGGTKDPFHEIASPLKFRQMIQMEIEKIGNQK